MGILIKKNEPEHRDFDLRKWSFALRFAAVPLALLLFLIWEPIKEAWDRMNSPCARLFTDEELTELNGPVSFSSVYSFDHVCRASYDKVTIEYERPFTTDSTAGFHKTIEQLRTHRDLQQIEEASGIASAYLAVVRNAPDNYRAEIVVERPGDSKITVSVHYPYAPTGEQKNRLISIVKARLPAADEFFSATK